MATRLLVTETLRKSGPELEHLTDVGTICQSGTGRDDEGVTVNQAIALIPLSTPRNTPKVLRNKSEMPQSSPSPAFP